MKALSAAVLLACAASPASHAAGLGKLTVLSSLGQPLHAEIELTAVGKDEGDDLRARLAPVEAYREASVDFNPALMSLRFAMERRAGRQFVRVTSSQPINEPYIDMLIELDGRNSRLLREYTFLLDPADLKLGRPAQIGVGAASRASSAAPAASNAASAGIPAAAPAAKRIDDKPAVDKYAVKPGDTLTEIAKTVRQENVSLDQMLVALYRGNGSAFIGNNMNRLRAGQILTVPDAGTARAVSDGEAHRIVIAQAADFNSYRGQLAAQVAGAAPERLREGGQTSTGKVTAQVEEPAAAAQPLDKLKLSRAGGHGAGQGNSAADAEERLAKDKAIAEANSRVQELEKNVRDLQNLLALKNRELAQRQQRADAARNPVQVEKAEAPPAVAMAKPAPTAVPTPDAETAPAAAKPADASVSSVAAPADVKADAAAGTPKKAAPAVKAPAAAESGFFSELSDNPMLLPGAGALLAALGALAVYRGVRRKKQTEPENTVLPESTLKANSLFGSTGGQSVDTNNSMFNSSFSASASQLDANEVDPVAEADVYIAYGRDVQAEEILKEALRTQPERNAVRLKLLEIYANRKDLRSFEIFASELYGMTKGEGGDWKQASALGLSIDPENPLYAGDALPDELAAKAAAITAPTQPLEEPASDVSDMSAADEAGAPSADDVEPGVLHLDLDADLEPSPTHAESAAMPKAAVSEASAKETFDAQLDSLDFDLAGFSGVRADDEKPADAESVDADMPTLNFELPMPNDGGAPASPGSGDLDSGDLGIETAVRDEAPALAVADASPDVLTAVESHHDEEDEAGPAMHLDMAPAAMDFDLSDIKLDLDAPLSDTTAAAPTDVGASLQLGTNAEMATKLDLAAAYQEIGDHEGARELLEEVMQGGSPQQVEEARGRLEKMA
ncbi:MAG: FimV/HubP family polar landmark protein [Burkholderiaceae bacterium]